MKLAVTDACIFIDLIELQLTSEFFGLPIEIHTSLDVYNEIYDEQKELLKAYRSVGKLKVHNITSDEMARIQKTPFPKSLSDSDKTVIFLAEKLNATVISSDKPVRNYSKAHAIEYHGMLWIFDQIIDAKLISPDIAIVKMDQLVANNIVYQNNEELTTEIALRKKKWKKPQ